MGTLADRFKFPDRVGRGVVLEGLERYAERPRPDVGGAPRIRAGMPHEDPDPEPDPDPDPDPHPTCDDDVLEGLADGIGDTASTYDGGRDASTAAWDEFHRYSLGTLILCGGWPGGCAPGAIMTVVGPGGEAIEAEAAVRQALRAHGFH